MTIDAARRIGARAGVVIFLALTLYGIVRAPEDILRRLNIFVGVITFLALLWDTWETKRLRQSTVDQTEALLMPVLSLTWRNARLYVENSGPGIARNVRLQPIHYVNLAKDVIVCKFRPVFALATGKEEELIADITRMEANDVAPRELKADRLAHVLEIASFGTRDWAQNLYFLDTRGRNHEVEFRWQNPDRPVGAAGLGDKQPRAVSIRLVKTIPDPLHPTEVRGISRMP